MTTIHFDRKIYFDTVRGSLFGGSMTEQQVIGQENILLYWENAQLSDDLRWLAYALATTKHETASTMAPIEEYNKGAGQPYGVKDKTTGQTYYGRGYVQLTWKDNYRKATHELELEGQDDLEWHAARALDPDIAADVMFVGMFEGWFRSPHNFTKYFNETVDDPYNAREIINGDKTKIPSWSGGVSIGKLIAGYHQDFLAALQESVETVAKPEVVIDIQLPDNVNITVTINGKPLGGSNVA